MVGRLLERRKARAAKKGAGLEKEDSVGIELRRKMNKIRVNMKIISKKITKFGKMGKIPMSAAARIYHQDSDEDDSSASSESVNSEINEHVENKHASPIFEKGLHYQPVFKKVVESSEKNLTKLIDLH